MVRKHPDRRLLRESPARDAAAASARGRLIGLAVAALVVAVPGASAQTPGGVAGSALWVKANQGVQANGTNQVEQWLDQSGSGNTASELRAASPAHTDAITPTNDILWVPGSINFNPSIDFSAASGRSLKGDAASNWTTGPLSIFAVALMEGGSGGNYGALWDAHANWTTGGAGTAGAGIVHSSDTAVRYYLDGNGCRVGSTTVLVLTQPRIARGVYVTGNNALNGATSLDGVQGNTGTNCSNVATTFFEVGGRTAGDSTFDHRIFNGKIAEVVVFKSDLSTTNDQKVESYLALKYGITLRRGTGSVGAPQNYLTSAGTTVWSGITNATYHNAVAGIVADSGSGLDQRVSQSVTPGAPNLGQPAIAAGAFDFSGTVTAQSPTATIGDQSALVWGHNNLSTTANVTITDPAAQAAGVELRMARVWRTEVTGSGLPSQVTIRIPATLIETANPSLRNSVLLISTAANFSTVTRTPIPLTKTGAFYFATFATFTPNEFFTIGGIVTVPDLSITKAAPGVMPAGANVTYTLTVSNMSTVFANNAVVTDTLPATLAFVSSTPVCSAIGQTVTCTLGALSPGQTLSIALTVQIGLDVPAGTIIENTASVSHADTDPTPANNTSTVSSPPVTTSADLSTTKAAIEASVTPGATFTYQIVETNNGPSPALNVQVTDTLPAPLAFISSSSGCTAAGQLVTCPPLASLAPSAQASFELVVRLDPVYTGDGSDLGNTATAMSSTPDPNPTNNTNSPAPPPTVNPPSADVHMVKSVSAATVAPGQNFTYTLTVTNHGPSNAVNVAVTDGLPTQVTLVSSTAGCSAVGQSVTCPTQASVAPGASATFDIVVQLDPSYMGSGSDVLNVAIALAETGDPFLANNSSRLGAAPVGGPNADLAIVKDVSTEPVTPGTSFFYRLTVANQGPSTAANVVVTDPLPVGVTFVSSSDGCTAAGQDVTCPAIASLVPGQAATFVLVVQLDPSYVGNGNDIQNVASVSSPTTDPVPGNNTSNPATPVIGSPEADVAIVKAVVESSVAPGGVFTYRLVVSNTGPSTALGVVVTDSLPMQVSFVSSPQGCTAAGQLVTCPPLGSLAVGTSVTYDIRVRLNPLYPGDGSDVVNIATSASSTRDPVPSNGTSAPVTLSVIFTGVDIGVALTAAPMSTVIGDVITFTATVTNLGPDAASGLTIALPLPPLELTFEGVNASVGGYDPGTGVWTIGTLPIGGTATMQLQARVMARGLPVVTASVAHVDQIERNSANDTASVTLNLTGWSILLADLVLDGTTTPVVAAGAIAAFELTAVNRGPSYVVDLFITGEVPPGTAFAGVLPSPGAVCATPAVGASGTVKCTWPAVTYLDVGAKRTMTVGVRVDAGAAPASNITGSFGVGSLSAEYYEPSNHVTLTTSVADGSGAADLALTAIMQSDGQTGTALAVPLGVPTPMRFTVRNNGPLPISAARYVIEAPDLGYLQIFSAAFSQGVVGLIGISAAEWQVGSLLVGASATFDLTVAMQSMRAATITMRRVSSAPADLSSANDRATLILDGTGHPEGGERFTAIGNIDGVGLKEVLVGMGRLETSQVRIYNGAGDPGLHFYAYSRDFIGGVRLAACDVDADGVDEIITAPGIGPGPHIRVLRMLGNVVTELVGFYAFAPNFPGGVYVSCADVDSDGRADVVAGMGQGGSQVKVFGVGKDFVVEKASFDAYEAGFMGGVRVAALGTTEPGGAQYQIVTASGPGRPLEVRAWAVGGGTATMVKALPLTGPDYQSGAFIDVADLNGDGLAEAVLATAVGMPSLVAVMTIDSAQFQGIFQAFPSSFLGGSRVTLGDVDNNGRMELLISPGLGGRPIVDAYTIFGGAARFMLRLNAIEIP